MPCILEFEKSSSKVVRDCHRFRDCKCDANVTS